jgi:hypothetical protein
VNRTGCDSVPPPLASMLSTLASPPDAEPPDVTVMPLPLLELPASEPLLSVLLVRCPVPPPEKLAPRLRAMHCCATEHRPRPKHLGKGRAVSGLRSGALLVMPSSKDQACPAVGHSAYQNSPDDVQGSVTNSSSRFGAAALEGRGTRRASQVMYMCQRLR